MKARQTDKKPINMEKEPVEKTPEKPGWAEKPNIDLRSKPLPRDSQELPRKEVV
jgi:hypothetical protein